MHRFLPHHLGSHWNICPPRPHLPACDRQVTNRYRFGHSRNPTEVPQWTGVRCSRWGLAIAITNPEGTSRLVFVSTENTLFIVCLAYYDRWIVRAAWRAKAGLTPIISHTIYPTHWHSLIFWVNWLGRRFACIHSSPTGSAGTTKHCWTC